MPPPRWSREDIDLNQYWVKNGEVYKVVAITESPTVTLRRIADDRADAAEETHVITSPNFARFARLRRVWVDGSADD